VQITDGKELCQICGTRASVVFCDGCSKPLCEECRKFDLWGYGCGHVDPKAFCHTCFDDVRVNPYSGKID
jgi:hypothetical protein